MLVLHLYTEAHSYATQGKQIMSELDLFNNITFCNTLDKKNAALYYAKIAPVFPLIPNSKTPLLQGSWKEYASQDPEVIKKWWDDKPDANIAWVMGNTIIASDLDMKGGENGWNSYQDLHPGEVDAPMQITPSGGYHLINSHVPNLINFTKKGRFGGIDMRTDNGYIVVAPSITGEGNYQWHNGGEIKPLPAAVSDAYIEWSGEGTQVVISDMPEPTPIADLKSLATLTLRQKHLDFLTTGLVHESYDGDRSRALMGAVIALFQLRLSDEDVLGYLLDSPGAMDCAVSHSSPRRASIWLWQYNCVPARKYRDSVPSNRAVQAFEGIVGDAVVPQQSEKERLITMAREVTAVQEEEAVFVYKEASTLGPLFANRIADLLHESAGFRKSDLEKAAKLVSKEVAQDHRQGGDQPRQSGQGLHVGHPALQEPVALPQTWEDLVGRYVYVATENKWIDRYTRETLAPEAVNAKEAHLVDKLMASEEYKIRPTDALVMRNDTLKVDVRSYWPGIKQDLIHIGNSDAINTWQPTTLERLEGDVSLWMNLVEHLFPDQVQRDRILDWMSFIVQYPHIKVNYALIVGGAERIGKDSIFQPLIHSVGLNNSNDIKAQMLDEKYDDCFMGIKLAVIQEIRKAGWKDAENVENKLKVYLADPPLYLTLRRLGAPNVKQINLIQVLAFTNYREALHLSSEGDRYCCEWSDAKKLSPQYYADVYSWYEKDQGYEKVFDYLMTRDVSEFNPKGSAPWTAWRDEMRSAGKSDLDYQVEDVLDRIRQENTLARTRKTAAKPEELHAVERFHETLYITPQQIHGRLGGVAHNVTVRTITNVLGNLKVPKVENHSKDGRCRVPRAFVDAFAASVGTGAEKYLSSIKAHVYAVEESAPVDDVSVEDLKRGLCPPSLIMDYLSSTK